MLNDFWVFILAVKDQWLSLLGSGMVAMIVFAIEHFRGRSIPWSIVLPIMLAGLLVACFLAWRCVYHQTQRQQRAIVDLREENSESRGDVKALRAQVDRLESEEARKTAAAVARLGERTQALADRPIRVTVTAPQEPRPKVTWTQEDVQSPPHEDAPHAVRVTVRADRTLVEPDLEIECNTAIAQADCDMPDFGYSGRGIRGTKFEFTASNPKLSPDQPWIFILSAKASISVIDVRLIWP